MSALQFAIVTLVGMFDEYAGKDGDNKTLTKEEMKDLLQKELPEVLKKADGTANDKAAVDEFFKELDLDKSNSVDFPEFLQLLGAFALSLHSVLVQS